MRQAQTLSNQNAETGQGIAANAGKNSQSLYNSLFPQYEQEATNPQGFTPGEIGSMDTAAQQSVGGSVAGAVGQGGLETARTRNAGGEGAALDQSVRSGQQELSQDALGVENENAMLKQANKQAGLSGLSSLYGQNESQQLGGLGVSNAANKNSIDAGQNNWFSNMLGLINAGANAGNAYANINKSGGSGGGGG